MGFCGTCYLITIQNDGTIRKYFLQNKKSIKINIYQLVRTGCFCLTFLSVYHFTNFCWEHIELLKRSLNCFFFENEYLKHVIDAKGYMKLKILLFFQVWQSITFLPALIKKAASRANTNSLVPSKCDYAKQICYSP